MRYRQRADGEKVKERFSKKKERRTTALERKNALSSGFLIGLHPLARWLGVFTVFTRTFG
jgi:hypothetical protein